MTFLTLRPTKHSRWCGHDCIMYSSIIYLTVCMCVYAGAQTPRVKSVFSPFFFVAHGFVTRILINIYLFKRHTSIYYTFFSRSYRIAMLRRDDSGDSSSAPRMPYDIHCINKKRKNRIHLRYAIGSRKNKLAFINWKLAKYA